MLDRPDKPITGRPLKTGYDAAIWRWINTLEKIMTEGLAALSDRIDRVAGGGGSGGNPYDGPLAVIAVDGSTVKVIDGGDSTNPTAGYYLHGISRVAIAASGSLTVTESGSAYVTVTWSGSAYVFTYGFAASLPASANGSIVRELASITVTSGTITNIRQTHFGDLTTPGVL